METQEGMIFHFYNIHMDAGDSEVDKDTREQQMEQLRNNIKLYSTGMPVIIAGDFNARIDIAHALFQPLRDLGFVSAAKDNVQGKGRVDQIWHRGASGIRFSNTPLIYRPIYM